MNVTIVKAAYDHCFMETELLALSRPWGSWRNGLTIFASFICVSALVGALFCWMVGEIKLIRYEYNSLNVHDPPQEEGKVD